MVVMLHPGHRPHLRSRRTTARCKNVTHRRHPNDAQTSFSHDQKLIPQPTLRKPNKSIPSSRAMCDHPSIFDRTRNSRLTQIEANT
jgi:hypothetical protein